MRSFSTGRFSVRAGRSVSSAEVRRIVSLRRKGLSLHQIGRKIHRDHRTVYDTLTHLSIPKPPTTKGVLNLKSLPNTELAYIAGLYDGEGHFGLAQVKEHLFVHRAAITNTDRGVIDWLGRRIGRGSTQTVNRSDGIRKTTYYFAIRRQADVVELIEAILPYLIIKRRHAMILLEWCRLRMSQVTHNVHSPREKELYLMLKKLNRRGPP